MAANQESVAKVVDAVLGKCVLGADAFGHSVENRGKKVLRLVGVAALALVSLLEAAQIQSTHRSPDLADKVVFGND